MFVGVLLPLCLRHLSPVLKITFVSNEDDFDFLVPMVSDFAEPLVEALKGCSL